MIRKTTLAHKVQGAYKLSQDSLGGKKKKIQHTRIVTFLIFSSLSHPVLPTGARGPSDIGKGETFGSEGGRVKYIQLCLIPWKYPACGS